MLRWLRWKDADVERLVGLTEIGALLGVSRQRALQLTRREDFPEPCAELAQGKVWRLEDVLAWAREQGREVDTE